jgi:hypothetical protein
MRWRRKSKSHQYPLAALRPSARGVGILVGYDAVWGETYVPDCTSVRRGSSSLRLEGE